MEYKFESCRDTVISALKAGVNYIDTAPWYGQGSSEEILGKCLVDVPRSTYYLATKVGRYEKDVEHMFDFSAKKTESSVQESLARLGINYIDVIQVHDMDFAENVDVVLKETLPVLEGYVRKGLVKLIGVTGYTLSILADCVARSTIKIDMVLSYARLTLIDSSLKNFLDFFKSKNVSVVNAATIAMGLLCNAGPQAWQPASDHIKSICREAALYCTSKDIELAKLAVDFGFHQVSESSITTQLVGVNNVNQLNANLDVLINGLSKAETEGYLYIQENIFTKLTEHHWENIEVGIYRKKIAEIKEMK